jgi:subtilase family serine protease
MKRIALAAEAFLLFLGLLAQVTVPPLLSASAAHRVDGIHTSHRRSTPGADVRLGPLPLDFPLSITLVLRDQHSADLGVKLAEINDPHSPIYHHFLTADQFSQQFGPSASAEDKVMQVLRAAGMRVDDADSSGSLLAARGTAAAVEALFGVQLDQYRGAHGAVYYSTSALPHVPAALSADVSGVLGLDSRSHLQTRRLVQTRSADTPAAGGLEPADLARAYNITSLRSGGLLGTKETVALAEIDTFSTTDITDYDRTFGLNAPPVQVVSVDGGATGNSPEAALDIETVQAVAPKAHIIAYEGGQDLSQLAQTFSHMVTDHRAEIISISLGVCELTLGGSDGQSFINAIDRTFQQASAEGISVLAASGDSGAYGCQNSSLSVGLPASNPYVTAVGGTTLYLNSSGSYGHEAGWEGPLEGAGTGGGLSQIYARPSWQKGTAVINSASNGMREVPDVAADADPLTGYLIYVSGRWQVMGGTSAGAPLWAGLIALADEAAADRGKPPLGFLNPALYALGSGSAGATPFHDVTIGGNLYYSATPGWDYATGWGSPDAAALIPALLGQ